MCSWNLRRHQCYHQYYHHRNVIFDESLPHPNFLKVHKFVIVHDFLSNLIEATWYRFEQHGPVADLGGRREGRMLVRNFIKQECIPVGCVPPAAVNVGGVSTRHPPSRHPPGPGTPTLPRARHPPPPRGQTYTCKHITLPQT